MSRAAGCVVFNCVKVTSELLNIKKCFLNGSNFISYQHEATWIQKSVYSALVSITEIGIEPKLAQFGKPRGASLLAKGAANPLIGFAQFSPFSIGSFSATSLLMDLLPSFTSPWDWNYRGKLREARGWVGWCARKAIKSGFSRFSLQNPVIVVSY